MDATLYNFRKMKVSELKESLKKRNLPLHGLKPLLLKRLEKVCICLLSDHDLGCKNIFISVDYLHVLDILRAVPYCQGRLSVWLLFPLEGR